VSSHSFYFILITTIYFNLFLDKHFAMSDEEMEKHLKELETINSLKMRQYYLTTLNKTNQINNNTNGSANLALAHDFLESDFRDKLLEYEEQIYNGSLGSIKV
jgi:hypothetical protein